MPNLLLCLTPGNSLSTWKRSQTIERELRPYLEYVDRGWNIRILTFQQEAATDYALPPEISTVVVPHARLLPLLPFMWRDQGKWADVIKTNQTVGSWWYVNAAKRWGKPILLRGGYVKGEELECTQGLSSTVRIYQHLERHAFREATSCAVTSSALSKWLTHHYSVTPKKINIIPNFVDANVFKPQPSSRRMPRSVISVGRLTLTKRFDLLIRACSLVGVKKLTIVGTGPEDRRLLQLADGLNVALTLTGQIPHHVLPEILVTHEVYSQVSSWEGHPKTLVEAMACGCCCLITNSSGLNTVIEHERTGWIVEETAVAVAQALEDLFSNSSRRLSLGRHARDEVTNRLAFDKVFETEFSLVSKLISQN